LGVRKVGLMMTYQTYNIFAIVFLSLCGIMLIISVFIFFKLKIISVIGDLSGITAKRQIEHFRELNLQSGNKKFKPSPINLNRGKLTEPIYEKTGKIKSTGGLGKKAVNYNKYEKNNNAVPISSEINTKNIPTDILPYKEVNAVKTNELSYETDVLEMTTDVLEDTNIENATELLDNGTEVLNITGELDNTENSFVPLKTILLIHTDEVIS
jgi:hypothetical protein